MKRVLFVLPSLNSGVGPPNCLINTLCLLPQCDYEYDLLLISRYDERFAHCWDRIPSWVNVLPPLYQLETFSPLLISELRINGLHEAADIKERVRGWNIRDGVDVYRNWEELKRITPEYKGYDIAIAYTEDIALQIVIDRVSARKKIGWIHTDYKLSFDQEYIRRKLPYWECMDKIVCVSHQNADSFAECYPGLREAVKVIYNPNDSTYIKKQAAKFYPQEYLGEKDCIKIFTAGTIGFRKGTDLIVNAIKLLLKEGYNCRWFLSGNIGGGESHRGDECVRLITEEGLEDHIVLLGYKHNPYPYFANCDIYVQPSRYEGLSIAIQEAMILHKPILVTNHSSVSEVITDGKTGIICDIDAGDLAQKLKILIGDEVLRDKLVKNLEKHNFTQNDTTSEIADLLR